MLDTNNPWVCLEDGEDDYVIERFELRVHGRKPLILNNPSFSKLMFVFQQFLHTSSETTKGILKAAILDFPAIDGRAALYACHCIGATLGASFEMMGLWNIVFNSATLHHPKAMVLPSVCLNSNDSVCACMRYSLTFAQSRTIVLVLGATIKKGTSW